MSVYEITLRGNTAQELRGAMTEFLGYDREARPQPVDAVEESVARLMKAAQSPIAGVTIPGDKPESAPLSPESAAKITNSVKKAGKPKKEKVDATSKAEAVTYEIVAPKFRAWAQEKGANHAIALLQKFGAQRLTDLPADKLGEFAKELV